MSFVETDTGLPEFRMHAMLLTDCMCVCDCNALYLVKVLCLATRCHSAKCFAWLSRCDVPAAEALSHRRLPS